MVFSKAPVILDMPTDLPALVPEAAASMIVDSSDCSVLIVTSSKILVSVDSVSTATPVALSFNP